MNLCIKQYHLVLVMHSAGEGTGVTLVLHHRLSSISTCGLYGLHYSTL